MNYELTKKLKDAGFIQKKTPVIFRETCIDNEGNLFTTPHECAYPPTLSELIKACGNCFKTLEQGKRKGDWYSTGDASSACGSTPEEAVAFLWLELNK